jgi:hypothetical protein
MLRRVDAPAGGCSGLFIQSTLVENVPELHKSTGKAKKYLKNAFVHFKQSTINNIPPCQKN